MFELYEFVQSNKNQVTVKDITQTGDNLAITVATPETELSVQYGLKGILECTLKQGDKISADARKWDGQNNIYQSTRENVCIWQYLTVDGECRVLKLDTETVQ